MGLGEIYEKEYEKTAMGVEQSDGSKKDQVGSGHPRVTFLPCNCLIFLICCPPNLLQCPAGSNREHVCDSVWQA